MHKIKLWRWPVACITLVASLVWSGCYTTANLSEHPLEGKSVALVSEIPDAPFADFDMTIFDRVGQDVPLAERSGPPSDPSAIVIRKSRDQGAPAPRTKVHALIDSVLVDFDMAGQMMQATGWHGAALMHFDTTGDLEKADYLLEVTVDDYGIGADAWHGTAYFEVMGRLKLIDNSSGRKLWEEEVMDIVPLTRALIAVGIPAEGMETPAALSRLSYAAMREVLTGLTGYAATRLVAPFQEAYFRSQPREEAHF